MSDGRKVALGTDVLDDISGFCGVATARMLYPDGHARIEVTSRQLERGRPAVEWFDECRLVTDPVPKRRSGFQMPASSDFANGEADPDEQ